VDKVIDYSFGSEGDHAISFLSKVTHWSTQNQHFHLREFIGYS
jgi:hypothetical protein